MRLSMPSTARRWPPAVLTTGRPACGSSTTHVLDAAQTGTAQWELSCALRRSSAMHHERIDWPRLGGSVVVWLLIASVVGMGLFALFDPGSIEVLVTAEL
jgi:hypothetical protein